MAPLLSRLRDTLRTPPSSNDTPAAHNTKAFRPGHINGLYKTQGATNSPAPEIEDGRLNAPKKQPALQTPVDYYAAELEYQQKIQVLSMELAAVSARLEESLDENKKLEEHDQAMQQQLDVTRGEIRRLRRRMLEELIDES